MFRRMKLRKDKPPSWWLRTSKIEKLAVAISLFTGSYILYVIFFI
jgi:hypothetical protein